MELANINELIGFEENKAVKKVPLLSANLMGSLLLLDSRTDMLAVRTNDTEEVHFVLVGDGAIHLDEEDCHVDEGALFLVPAGSRYRYATKDKRLVVLIVKHLCERAEQTRIEISLKDDDAKGDD